MIRPDGRFGCVDPGFKLDFLHMLGAGTEQHIGENGLGGESTTLSPLPLIFPYKYEKSLCGTGVVPDKTDPYMRTDLPVWNWTAALGLAKGINQGYLTANQTAMLIWTPTCKRFASP